MVERSEVLASSAQVDPSYPTASATGDAVRVDGERLVLQRHWSPAIEVEIPAGVGGHGGGDRLLFEQLYRGTTDSLGRAADFHDGLRAVAVGIAGNDSLVSGAPATVDALELGGWAQACAQPQDRRRISSVG